VPSVTEAQPAYRTVTSFFSADSTSKHDKHNTLNLKLALLCLKHRVSTKLLPIANFFGEKEVVYKKVLK
jgi:hypothetical protein